MTETIPLDDLIFACTHLADLLELENEALAAHDVATVKELVDNKTALARLYERAMVSLADDPSLVEGLEPEQKDELLALGRHLQALIDVNANRLQAEMDACRMVMDVFAKAVKANTISTVSYGRAGTYDAAAKGSPANSLSVNKTL